MRSHLIAETAKDNPIRSLPTGSSAGLAVEPEDKDGYHLDAQDAFFDTSPVLYASPGFVVPPHIRKRVKQVTLALLTETLDPRRTLFPALEDVTGFVGTPIAHVFCSASSTL